MINLAHKNVNLKKLTLGVLDSFRVLSSQGKTPKDKKSLAQSESWDKFAMTRQARPKIFSSASFEMIWTKTSTAFLSRACKGYTTLT